MQEQFNIKNNDWYNYQDKSGSIKDIVCIFNETEKISKHDNDDDLLQEWNELRSKAEIRQHEESIRGIWREFFVIDLDLLWWNKHRWINRRLDKVVSDGWRDLQILDNLDVRIPYTKENKSKLKNKIKNYLSKQLDKHLQDYFNEKYLTSKMPDKVDYLKLEEIHKENLKKICGVDFI